MLNSRVLDYRIGITFFLSAALGVVLNNLLPVFAKHSLFLWILPMGGLFLALLIIKPKWTLVLMLLSRPLLDPLLDLTKVSIGGEKIGIGAALNLAVIILATFSAFYYSTFPRQNQTVLCWIVFLVLMFAAVVYSPFHGRAIRLYFNFLSYFSMFILPFLVIKTRQDFLFWLKILAWSFVLPVFAADVDFARGGQYFEDAGNRIMGTFTHPNILAFYLVLGIILYFYILRCPYWKLNSTIVWVMRILILNMVVLLIATKTRNAWLACFSGFFIYGILKDRKILLVLLLLLPIFFMVPSIKERAVSAADKNAQMKGYQGINSFDWRWQMWESSFSQIAQRPLQGYGLTSFQPLSEQFSNVGRNRGAHNVYIEVLFETGILGLLSFLSLFLSPLRIFLKNMRKSFTQNQSRLWALAAGYVISYMIICSADNLSYYLVLNWYVWFFIGLMLVSGSFIKDVDHG